MRNAKMQSATGDDENAVSIGVLKEIRETLNHTTNNFHHANLLRETGFILFQESAKNSEELASVVLGDVLDTYKSVVTSTGEGSVNNYTDRVVRLLKRSRKSDLSKWKTSIADQDDALAVLNKCAGEYESCASNEVTEADMKQFREMSDTGVQKRKMPYATIVEEVSPHRETFVQPVIPKLLHDPFQVAGPSKAPVSIGEVITSDRSKQQTAAVANNLFRTARDELALQNLRKYGSRDQAASAIGRPDHPDQPLFKPQNCQQSTNSTSPDTYQMPAPQKPYQSYAQSCQQQQQPLFSYGASKKSLGARRTVQSKFIPPVKNATDGTKNYVDEEDKFMGAENEPAIVDDRLKNIDPKMVELISNEIMWKLKPVGWDDIAGLEYAKSTIQEAVVWPMLRPDIFTGLRRPPRGILLFGPPGTGKTLIGKCIASQSNSTFFSISASSLTSKWIGDGEKMVRALFAVAAVNQPSVIFIDEVDSLLCQRSESEHESSRRIKTEFLVQLDGAMTSDEERILIVGATNRPQELDEAARRRFIRRLYIPLPEHEARLQILNNLLQSVRHSLTDPDVDNIGKMSHGYSGADMESLCREASMEPIRSIPPSEILYFNENEVRPINFMDFQKALSRIRASVSQNDLLQYDKWNDIYGSGASS